MVAATITPAFYWGRVATVAAVTTVSATVTTISAAATIAMTTAAISVAATFC
jgi:hypothetical protein